ncbi:hypothetical protein Pse7367_2290 [Thalassoporum mexicanum PCC 7367]|uniref:LmeA family phospholipid-binding protein n=1 Tax=Thalassoporum mexicanum TaxID=3457544 RepID=UPI00029FFC98|nr:DUF2993 domain-containing protein [Pseudanabaena sp. PCC 7367]AFY70553.1 hypothetical protein Pse7367_2290 [Pseudanabaena sp. PCC 7367]
MDWAVGILSTLFGLAGTPGIVIDRVATNFVRSQVHSADVLEVRIENTPNYQVLQGDVDRLLVAGRGVYIQPFLRVDTIDLETDPISVNAGLGEQDFALRKPLQAAVRVIITSADVNLALRSPEISDSFQGVEVNFSADPSQAEIFDLNDPRVEFLDGDRIRLTAVLEPSKAIKQSADLADLADQKKNNSAQDRQAPLLATPSEDAFDSTGDPDLGIDKVTDASSDRALESQAQDAINPAENEDRLEVLIEASLRVENGVRLQISDPIVNLQGVAVPKDIIDAFVDGLNKVLDLRQLEETGIIARVLQFKVTDGQMQVVGFAQLQPEAFE